MGESTYTGYLEPFPGAPGDGFMMRAGRPGQHRGSDRAPGGIESRSPADGVLVAKHWTHALGNIVVIRHADGKYTGKAHLATQSRFAVGSFIPLLGSVGAQIGNTGSASKGRHEHTTLGDDLMGIVEGHVQDPRAWYAAHPPLVLAGGKHQIIEAPEREDTLKFIYATTDADPDPEEVWVYGAGGLRHIENPTDEGLLRRIEAADPADRLHVIELTNMGRKYLNP